MQKITVKTQVAVPLEKAWDCFTQPEHITQWYFASDDWHAPSASNTLEMAKGFNIRMEAKDGSFGFDFTGIYSRIIPYKHLDYTMEDGRKVNISFTEENGITTVTEVFDPETENPVDMQETGWQSILNNFKKYTESH